MQWVSPITLDMDKNVNRDTKILLKSSPKSWLSSDTNIQPNFNQYPQLGFPGLETTGKTQDGEGTAPYILGVSIRGSFDSFFKPGIPGNKLSPFEAGAISPAENVQGPPAPGQEPTQEAAKVVGTIEKSPETTRLVVIGSSSFVDDFVLGLSSRLSQDRYLNNLRFLQNAVDWSVEDLDLLTIRSRGTATRVLAPMDDRQQTMWEVLNYAMALAALLGIYFYWRYRKQNENPLELLPIKTTEQETGRKLS
jgi:ABC-2 type transport system permease protein